MARSLRLLLRIFTVDRASLRFPSHWGGNARPPPRGPPPRKTAQVGLMAVVTIDMVWNLVLVSCLFFLFALCVCYVIPGKLSADETSWPSAGQSERESFWGISVIAVFCLFFAFLWAVPLVGRVSGLLGTEVPQNESPEAWGGPWALHPAVFIFKGFVVCLVLCLRSCFFPVIWDGTIRWGITMFVHLALKLGPL